MSAPAQLWNQRFGRLTVRAVLGQSQGQRLWVCDCECGGEAQVTSRDLTSGHTKSCGCLQREVSRSANVVHGKSGTSTHNLWMSMIDRCERPKSKRYADYGGRGIAVCERWHSFKKFLADMGERPLGKSLDRIDVDGPYSPENCRWADRFEQANNARSNKKITHNSETYGEAEWARLRGMTRSTLQHRLNAGWPVAQALGFEERPQSKRYLRCASKK